MNNNRSHNCVLSIVGPTATGKTAFALQVAKNFSRHFSRIDIISADSRQIYAGMEIGTGVDIPPNFAHQIDGTFRAQKVLLHGLAFVKPTAEWSVAHFRRFARGVIEKSWAEGGLPIVVGGTGLYQDFFAVTDERLDVPPDSRVRLRAAQMSLHALQQWVKKTAPQKWSTMNVSDRANPRRLVRAIELTQAPTQAFSESSPAPVVNQLTIGLTDTRDNLATRIVERVQERFSHGMIEEVQQLIADYSPEDWQKPAFSATGYQEVRDFLEEKLTEAQALELWTRRETQYAKRQLTWWKKAHDSVQWFPVSEKGWQKDALALIQKWLESSASHNSAA